MSLVAFILAADEARLKSRRPVVLHEIAGRPLIHYVLQAAYDAGCQHAMVVIDPGSAEQIVAACGEDDDRLTWVRRNEGMGEADVLRASAAHLKRHGGSVVILPGNAPLVRADVLRTLVNAHRDERAAASLATARVEEPAGLPEVIRNVDGGFVRLVDMARAADEQRAVCEIAAGYYCFRSEDLFALLRRKKRADRKPRSTCDLLGLLIDQKKPVVAVEVVPPEEVALVRTRQDLADADAVMQDRIHRRLRDGGVTLVNSPAAYVEDGVTIGPDTVIHPFTFIGRDSSIGPGCVLGPFAMLPRQSIVPEGVTIAGNVTAETATLTAPGG